MRIYAKHSDIGRIETAVLRICRELQNDPPSRTWVEYTESELIYELTACILGSQVPYELALAAVREIYNAGLLICPMNTDSLKTHRESLVHVLKQPLQYEGCSRSGRRYRFAVSRADHICRTLNSILSIGGSLRKFLQSFNSAREARRSVVNLVTGMGPKQASLFLRNIGFSEHIAILDSHVLRFMSLLGLSRTDRSITSIRYYEEHETALKRYARNLDFTLGRVDLAIWIVMRVYLREKKE